MAAALIIAASAVRAQTQADRPARVSGHPNFNGIWQALNQAHWNLESHSAEALNDFAQLGAIAAIPAGRSVVREGTIPYLPEALAKRNENRAKWPAADPEAKCYMLGVPRVTYHNLPFQIFQGDGDLLMVYPFAAANRVIHLTDRSELPVDSWMGKSDGTLGRRRARGHHERAERPVVARSCRQPRQQPADGHRALHAARPNHIRYEATLDDPQTYTRPWTIEMPLYRADRPAGTTARAQVRALRRQAAVSGSASEQQHQGTPFRRSGRQGVGPCTAD